MRVIPTFIISKSVLNTMSIMIKYSNGVETTIRHTLYLKLFRSFGMYRSSGRAPIVKSMHDFYRQTLQWKTVTESCTFVSPDSYQFHHPVIQPRLVLEM